MVSDVESRAQVIRGKRVQMVMHSSWKPGTSLLFSGCYVSVHYLCLSILRPRSRQQQLRASWPTCLPPCVPCPLPPTRLPWQRTHMLARLPPVCDQLRPTWTWVVGWEQLVGWGSCLLCRPVSSWDNRSSWMHPRRLKSAGRQWGCACVSWLEEFFFFKNPWIWTLGILLLFWDRDFEKKIPSQCVLLVREIWWCENVKIN